MKFFARFLTLAAFLPAFTTAAFIDSPIPPSEARNFFADTDADGRMDFVEIVFLGNLSREYLDSTVSELSFFFPDSVGKLREFAFAGQDLPFDSLRPNIILIDLSADKNISARTTELSITTKTATILFADSSRMNIRMREKLPPQILAATNFSLDRGENDSLVILFSEPVEEISPDFIEILRAGSAEKLFGQSPEWNAGRTRATFLFPKDSPKILARDSLRILAGSLRDSSKNLVPENSPAVEVRTFSSFRLRTNSLVNAPAQNPDRTPIFELRFAEPSERHPTADELGLAIDFGKSDLRPADRENLSLAASLKLYTTRGEYVTGVHFEVQCSDDRFAGDCIQNPRTVFLKWNLMSNDRRFVGTGAYLAKITAIVRSRGVPVWQKTEVQSWGVRRESHGKP